MLSAILFEAINSLNMAPYTEREGNTANPSSHITNEDKHLSVSSSTISIQNAYRHCYHNTTTTAQNIHNYTMSRDDQPSVRIISNNCLTSNSIPRPAHDAQGRLPHQRSSQSHDEQCIIFSPRRIRFADDESSSYIKSNNDPHKKMDTANARQVRETYLSSQIETLGDKIQKAVCFELRCLQSLEELTQKRMRWEENHREALSRRPLANSECESTVLENYIAEANGKIAKALKIEFSYKRRVKELHDKRYRWSMLYENASRELLELDPSRSIPSLPPLFAPSFLRK